jgi:hypothetical protein
LFSLDGRLRRQRDTTTVANVGCATLRPHASAGVLCYRRPRRRRRRLAPAAADMGVSGGGTTPPSVARLCRWRNFATCVRWVLGWPGPTDAQWYSHVLCLALNTRAIQNLCAAAISIAILLRTGSPNLKLHGIYLVYTRYIAPKIQMSYDWYMLGIYLLYDKCRIPGNRLVYTMNIPVI